MYKCIIVDDEPYAIEGLKRYIEAVPNLELVQSFTDPLKALLSINAGDKVDLILMDIDMPDISGIELSKEIRKKTEKLVFTTGYTKYGYEAYEANGDAYLLKPYTLSKFAGVISKLFPEQVPAGPENTFHQEYFFIKDKGAKTKMQKVKIQDITYIEANENYVNISLRNEKEISAYMPLNELCDILTEQQGFYRFQRSFLVNVNYIASVEGYLIRMSNAKAITVGGNYRQIFNDFLAKKIVKADRRNA